MSESPELSSRRRALVEKLLKQRAVQNAPSPIVRRTDSGDAPVSFSQERLWFLHRLEPSSSAYNVIFSFRFRQAVDVAALQRSLDELVRRHGILRSTFPAVDSRPVQRVAPEPSVALSVIDATDDPTSPLERVEESERQRPFDLERGPLLRATLVDDGTAGGVLILAMHHIVVDGWSTGILIRELSALYSAFLEGRSSPLAELPIEYADYAAWQRQTLQGETLERHLDYWRGQLADAATLQLPLDRLRLEASTTASARVSARVEPSVAAAFQELCRREATTSFTALLAAFAALLHRWSGQDDIVVGTPVANRGRPETEPLIGFFINMLVLRTRVFGDESFRDLIAHARDGVTGAMAHQDMPFEKLVAELAPTRDLGINPLFQVTFALQNAAQTAPDSVEPPFDFLPIEASTTRFDLEAHVVDEGGAGLLVTLIYNTGLFDESTIHILLQQYLTLLRGAIDEPGSAVCDLPLIDADVRQRMNAWNDAALEYPRGASVQQLVERQVEVRSDAPAVVWGDASVSYGELNARANRIAHYLKRRGVNRGTRVALGMTRGIDLVAAMLGILKAGAAYVPLDPDYPEQRLAFMLDDTNPAVLLTERAMAAALPAGAVQLVILDEEAAAIAEEPVVNPDVGAAGDDVAYVIYTSGSTGTPKGVCVTHRGIVRLVSHANFAPLTPDDVIAQASNSSFDAATFEFWGALINGARMVGVRRDVALAPEALARLIEEQRISALFLTTALFNQVARERPSAFSTVRHLMFGGEAVDARAVARVLGSGPPERLLHVYGPTENTTFSTWFETTSVPEAAITVPIGRAVSNSTVHVLDRQMRAAAPGVPGEIFVGGDGLAIGYLNRPAMTAEKFVPSPFGNGDRLYRTGDIGRWTAEGYIEFIGRNDDQVKIRGFRIELGEIEAMLATHPGVSTAAVLAREITPGTRRLVAYIVGSVPAQLDIAEVRAFLKARLPDYMVPSALMELPALPLNANGKIDRAALPAPDPGRAADERADDIPSPVAARLAAIWARVLGLAKVGVHDNFFDLGGDSILSIQIVARAQEAGFRLTAKDLFRHQTVSELAAVAEAAIETPLEAPAALDSAPLIPVQRWFFEQNFADAHYFNQSVFLEATRRVDPATVERAVRDMVFRHEALRLRFSGFDENRVQRLAATNDEVPFAVVDLSSLSGNAQLAVLQAEAERLQATLSLEGPLLRCVLFELGGGAAQKLFITIHHLAVDGVSWRILIEDLERACGNEWVAPSPATTSYLVWAQRLAEYARTDAAATEARFWADAPLCEADLPVDDPSGIGRNTIGDMSSVQVALSQEETDALLHHSPRAFKTQINDVLLTAVALAVSRWTGRRATWLDLEGHGREPLFADIDLSRTVGWFTSIFPVALSVPESPDAIDALKHVKEALRAVPHRGIGYGVARYGSADADLRAGLAEMPAPQISFNYLGQFDRPTDEPSLFRAAALSAGIQCSPGGRRPHFVDVIGAVREGRLTMSWQYCPHLHHHETVERLAADFLGRLRELIARTAVTTGAGATPSDFPLASLDQCAVDRLCGAYPDLEDVYALSPLQEGLLFHTALEPQDGAYVEQLAATFEGALDLEAMRQAWQVALNRHAILRTAFVWHDLDQPVQVVRRHVALPWLSEDWRGTPAPMRASMFAARCADERNRGFDLSAAPALRLLAIRLGEHEYATVWTFHHILLDGWSIQIFFKEVSALYRAIVEGHTPVLPAVQPYRRYIEWIEEHRDTAEAEAFWREYLDGAPDSTLLNLAKPSAVEPGYHEEWLRLSIELSDDLRDAARRHQLTLNSFVQAAWALLLSRYTGQDDVVFGATVSGRPGSLSHVESMVGLFINTVPVRMQLPRECSMLSIMRQLQDRQVDAREFEHVRLADVQKWGGGLAGGRWFDTLLAFENYPIDRSRISDGGPAIRDVHVSEQTHYALTAVAVPNRQLAVRVGFDGAHIDRATVMEMLDRLRLAFEVLARDPETLVRDISLFQAGEREAVLTMGVGANDACPPVTTVNALFERQAASNPGREAVRCGEDSLTYRELDERANQWAHCLARHRVGPDVVVGVSLDGGVELIAVLLGIVKAGGAYLALDPSYPTLRLQGMLEETRTPVIVTSRDLADRLSIGPDVTVLCVETVNAAVASEPPTRLPVTLQPEHLVYVSYTSGSTGRPKGVAVPHRGVARLLFGVDYATFGPDDTWLQLAPVGFDASTLEIWGALLHGGRLVMTRDRLPTPESIGALLAAERVTSLWLTASLFNAVIDAVPEALRPVRQLLIGGEALSVAHVRRAIAALPQTKIINGYGPTESTTFTCCYPIHANDVGSDARSIPIGRPIGHTRVSVLDHSGDTVPAGVVGELFIGGDGLARGYIGQPARSAERFVPDPCGTPGARLYRTGDLVRWTPDRVLEFVGRVDTQVKIRGFRIETAEIEVALGTHPSVQSGAVVVREDIPGTKRLVAYVVPAERAVIDEDELRRHLQLRLPEYMVPAAFIALAAMPRTANGKLDRDALPAPEWSRAAEGRKPATPTEIALAAIWSDVLRMPEIGIDENYFELGGDSILSIQICSRAQRAGWDLTPKQLFEHQTIADAASVMRPRSVSGATGAEVSGRVALLPAQRWFFEQNFADPHHFTQGMMLEVGESLSVSAIDRALHAVVAHHDVLRARFKRSESGWTQNILPSKPPAIGLVSRVELTPKERSAPSAAIERAAIAVQASLDLESGPLLRAVVFEAPGIRSRLLMVVHHLLVDAVSWRVLLEDLELACRQIQQDEPVQLPSRTSSVREWAQALSDFARQPSLGAARDWWLNTAAVPAHPLPVDYPGGTASNTAGSSARVSVGLTEEETRALLQTVPKAYYTQINDALLTAMVQAIAPWTQSNTLLVDLEGHGREPISDTVDLARTIGWFTSITPVPLTLPPDSDVGGALRAVKEQLRALPGGALAYGSLRYFSQEAGTKASLAAGARAEVSFNYLGQVDRMLPGDALFSVAPESSGPTSSPRQRRPHLLDVVGFVSGAQLRFEWIYSPHVHGRGTIEALARRFVAALRAIIAHCANAHVTSHTPSDFPLARVEQRGLDLMRARYAGLTITDLYPASPLQQGMLFHSLAAPNSSVFTTQVCCQFDDDLDVAALRQAWADALARHAILRTAFVIDSVEAFHQAVFQDVQLPWTMEDWSHRPPADREAALADWLRADRARGFDISQAPLMRMAVIKQEARRHCFVWTHHHALLDGWSFAMVLGEVFAAYQSRHDGTVPRFAHRSPYRDYIAWLQRQDRAAAERYWRETLAGFTAATALSVDEASGARRSGAETHDEQILYVDESVTRRIEALAHEHRVTLNTVVQGAWAMLLSKYSGDTDVVFGTTVSGRPSDLPGVEEMIGLFMNGLPLRVELPQQQPLAEWLQVLQRQHLEMRQYEGTALVDIQGWSEIPRGAPLFETTLVFENYPEGESLRADVRGAGMSAAQVVSNTSSALHLRAIPGRRLALRLVHDSQRFSVDTTDRMVRQLEHLLRAFTEHPREPLSSFSVLMPADAAVLPDPRRPLRAQWNGGVHEEFSRRAAEAPNRPAIVDGGGTRSYGHVDRRSNQIAHALRESAIGSGDVVAILAERNAELVEAALGVLKSGAAFVILDLAHPASRLASLARIANARGMISTTEEVSDEILASLRDLHLAVDLSVARGRSLEQHQAAPLDLSVRQDDLAYVAFTSGSTGRPKGILGLHGALAQFAHSAADQFGLGKADRFAALSALSHDPLLRDMFPPLQLGATLHIPDAALMGRPSHLVEWMHASEVTTCNLTPALARLLTDVEEVSVPSLRHAFVVGEVLTRGDVARLKRLAPQVSCMNFYGSTEAQQALAWHAADDAVPGERLPIGRGMDGVQLLVVTDGGELAGVGEVGEIYVRTPYLARGYADPSLTAERFQQNPFSKAPGDRVYRSGDRGRYLPNGAVAFVGRRDAQVKIRGFRVEPAEVEAVLMSHEAVREAAVVPYGSDRDDRVLAAYVVGTVDRAELRSFLSARLPLAMVPAHFVCLERLPRTVTGKLNRLALPEPDRRNEGASVARPMSPFEETLAGFWRELLRVEHVGPDANFFDHGGHSLLAARLIARVREEFQIDMPIGSLFDHPTIAEFALAITHVLLADESGGDDLVTSIKDLSDQSIQELIDADASLVGDDTNGE